MTESSAYDELYTLLLRLCEASVGLPERSRPRLMEAFNDLSELHVPWRLWPPSGTTAANNLQRSLALLESLAHSSAELHRTLALMRIQGLVREAVVGAP